MPDLAQPDLPDHWTGGIDELVAAANALLPALLPPERSTRQKDEINARLVRHYTTTGHLPPAGRSGRDALYSRRHLLALLALRRLMAEGIGGAMLHGLLAGQGEDVLERAALRGLGGITDVPRPQWAAHEEEAFALLSAPGQAGFPEEDGQREDQQRQRAVSFLQGLRPAQPPAPPPPAVPARAMRRAPRERPSREGPGDGQVEQVRRLRPLPGVAVLIEADAAWPSSEAEWTELLRGLERSLRDIARQ